MSRVTDGIVPERSGASRRARRGRARKIRRVAVAVVILGAIGGGGTALVRSPLFAVDGIDIRGAELIGHDEVLGASGLRLGMNVLSVDAGRVERRIESLPLVAGARVERLYPSRVRIHLTERKPAATARLADGSLWLIEADGSLITRTAAPVRSLPEVRVAARQGSPALAEALRLWSGLPTWAREKTTDLAAGDPSMITAKIGGTVIVFGSSDEVIPKMQAVVAIFERAKAGGRRVARIDVRAPRRPAAVFA